MGSTTINLPTQDQMDELLEAVQKLAAYQLANIVASDTLSTILETHAGIQAIVKAGLAEKIFDIGDQVVVDYTFGSTVYECPFDIVAFQEVELEDGETVDGMILQMHYATYESLMFDAYEAFYYAEEGLDAGTYYVTMGYTSNKVISGTSYEFTLTEAVPSGGALAGFRLAASSSLTSEITELSVYSYDSDRNMLEAVSISEGSDGTFLGTFYQTSAAAESGLNHAQRVFYGYGRWAQSAYRQWLNSAAAAGGWWESQNDYDLPPDQLSAYAGFMAGFDDDFLSILQPIKVTTALNTVEGLDDTSEDTIDTFFLPSLEQLYIKPQLSGVEGDYWPYWKRATGAEEPQAQYGTYSTRITYALHSHSSAQNVRLRSANRSTAITAWFVYSSGLVSTNYAYSAARCAPACVIA